MIRVRRMLAKDGVGPLLLDVIRRVLVEDGVGPLHEYAVPFGQDAPIRRPHLE